jgi:hypothetical protein
LFPIQINLNQHMVFTMLEREGGGPRSERQRLNLGKLYGQKRGLGNAGRSGIAVQTPLVASRRTGSAQCCIDFRLNTPSRKRGQPGLRSAGLDLIAKLKPPFPDIGFGGRHDSVFQSFIDHGIPPFEQGRIALLDFKQSALVRNAEVFPAPEIRFRKKQVSDRRKKSRKHEAARMPGSTTATAKGSSSVLSRNDSAMTRTRNNSFFGVSGN